MKRHYPKVLVAVAACALLATACGSPDTSNDKSAQPGKSGAPQQGGSVTLAVEGTDLANLNTQMTSNTGPLILADLWADGLFAYDAEGKRVPHLATSSAESPDGMTYTLKLRPNVKFSDGTPFSSADVAYNLNVLAKFNTYLTNVLPKIQGRRDARPVDRRDHAEPAVRTVPRGPGQGGLPDPAQARVRAGRPGDESGQHQAGRSRAVQLREHAERSEHDLRPQPELLGCAAALPRQGAGHLHPRPGAAGERAAEGRGRLDQARLPGRQAGEGRGRARRR